MTKYYIDPDTKRIWKMVSEIGELDTWSVFHDSSKAGWVGPKRSSGWYYQISHPSAALEQISVERAFLEIL